MRGCALTLAALLMLVTAVPAPAAPLGAFNCTEFGRALAEGLFECAN